MRAAGDPAVAKDLLKQRHYVIVSDGPQNPEQQVLLLRREGAILARLDPLQEILVVEPCPRAFETPKRNDPAFRLGVLESHLEQRAASPGVVLRREGSDDFPANRRIRLRTRVEQRRDDRFSLEPAQRAGVRATRVARRAAKTFDDAWGRRPAHAQEDVRVQPPQAFGRRLLQERAHGVERLGA